MQLAKQIYMWPAESYDFEIEMPLATQIVVEQFYGLQLYFLNLANLKPSFETNTNNFFYDLQKINLL